MFSQNRTVYEALSYLFGGLYALNHDPDTGLIDESDWAYAWKKYGDSLKSSPMNPGTWDHIFYAHNSDSRPGKIQPALATLDLSGMASRNIIRFHCTCPSYRNHVFCQHIMYLIHETSRIEKNLLPAILNEGLLFQNCPAGLLSPECDAFILRNNLSGHNNWRQCLGLLQQARPQPDPVSTASNKTIWYALTSDPVPDPDGPVMNVFYTEPHLDGKDSPLKPLYHDKDILNLTLEDQTILKLLEPVIRKDSFPAAANRHLYRVKDPLIEEVFSRIQAGGHLLFREPGPKHTPHSPLKWEPDPFRIILDMSPHGSSSFIRSALKRDQTQFSLQQIRAFLPGGLAITENRLLIRIANPEALPWFQSFNSDMPFPVASADLDLFLSELPYMPYLPFLLFPAESGITQQVADPEPTIVFIHPSKGRSYSLFKITFNYGNGINATYGDTRSCFYSHLRSTYIERNFAFENEKLQDIPFNKCKILPSTESYPYKIGSRLVFPLIQQLIEHGWRIEIEGKLVKKGKIGAFQVHSGIDWFDLSLDIDFDGEKLGFSELLKQIKASGNFITLSDGSKGIIDPTWKEKLAGFLSFSKDDDDTFKFHKSQALILDALLMAMPEVNMDEQFTVIRKNIKEFSRIQPCEPPDGFAGTLRPYQKEGLGWLYFLQKLGINGCLADDMGLGKTVQVLALLQGRRNELPSLVVVPKSLIQNWLNETNKFTPSLRTLVYDGPKRKHLMESFTSYNLVIMTYGVMRRDITELKDMDWDYIILDESQAIKNQLAQSTRAARLLQSSYKLALTGTPIENHVGELWSQFEFLNPGILGHSSLFKILSSKKNSLSPEEHEMIARGLKPFILRRTKDEVLKELPRKTEQTLICQMDKNQRAIYEETRLNLRRELLGKVESKGLNSSKIHVLEALLRLRQVACHPGLVNIGSLNHSGSSTSHDSIKFQILIQHLEEIIAEGHKALIFSQFTKLLGLLKREIFQRGWAFEYLDGKSTRREDSIQRFQNDKNVPLFLISLRAGGLGLNLTAADYVYILDPWWNPAVENQAIDRAHRIGQDKSVFAYRLIVKDTVEEKILKLQKSKKNLAEALISQNQSILSNLTAEDLNLLLS